LRSGFGRQLEFAAGGIINLLPVWFAHILRDQRMGGENDTAKRVDLVGNRVLLDETHEDV